MYNMSPKKKWDIHVKYFYPPLLKFYNEFEFAWLIVSII